jgi:hypothetical protein
MGISCGERLVSVFDDRENVGLAEDDVGLAVELDLIAGVLAEQDLVAGLDDELDQLVVIGDAAGSGRDHECLLRLFLGGLWNVEAPGGAALALEALDEEAVIERTEVLLLITTISPHFA